jgi:hypothetical protein
VSDDQPADDPARRRIAERAAARARIEQQQTWVDVQVRRAMERGDFDDLPGAGKPIPDLGEHHDPDWWLKKMVQRENIAVLPPSLQLRKEDAELDGRLDGLAREDDVRREVEDFNTRVVAARYGTPSGPPLVTMPRDVDTTVAAWRERRESRLRQARPRTESPPAPVRRRWGWLRRRGVSPGTR